MRRNSTTSKRGAPTEGAEAVGRLVDMPACEALLIRAVRGWADGPEGQTAVWNLFASTYGAEDGRIAMRAFERFLSAVAGAITRALARHAECCPCVGRDEATLAVVMRHAAMSETTAAMEAASIFAEPRMLLCVVDAAADLGLVLIRAEARRRRITHSPRPGRPMLH